MNDTGKSAKLAKYDRLYEQIKGYIHTTEDIWARLATMEAVLHHKMQTFFWTGVRGVYRIVHKKLERKCERKACKYKEFERFEGDLGKKNEMYTGLICFNLV